MIAQDSTHEGKQFTYRIFITANSQRLRLFRNFQPDIYSTHAGRSSEPTNGALSGGEEEEARQAVTSQPPGSHTLYLHNVCRWPGCDLECRDLQTFLK